jgi:hypothetical protein
LDGLLEMVLCGWFWFGLIRLFLTVWFEWLVGLDGLDYLRAPCLEDDNLVVLAVCHEEMLEVAAAG